MSHETGSRRDFLAAVGAAFGAAWLAARPEELQASLSHAARAARAPRRFEVLTPEQAADIDALCARILPTDDLPGAREAGAVAFVDHALATWARDQRQPTLDGLAAWNRSVSEHFPSTARFALLTGDQQVAFITANDRTPFFQGARFMTLVATFSHPDWGGNKDKAGWRILGFEDRYVWQPPFGWYDAQANGGPN
jgi:gluconate 2-dehydrogenase gamma chain